MSQLWETDTLRDPLRILRDRHRLRLEKSSARLHKAGRNRAYGSSGFSGGCSCCAKNGSKVPLKSLKMKIGRDPSNQVVIPDDTFTSRHHAWITFEDNDFWLEDLGSTNGTLLNGHPVVKRQVLSAGDKIRVGHTELTFESEKN